MRVPCARSTCLQYLCIGSSGSAGQRRPGRFRKKAYQYRMQDSHTSRSRANRESSPSLRACPSTDLKSGVGSLRSLLIVSTTSWIGPMNPIVAVRVGISRSAHLMAQSLAAALDLARAVIRQPAATIKGALPGELVFASCLAAQQSAGTRRVRSGPSPAQASGAISQTNGPDPEALAWCTAPLNVGAPCSRSPQRGALRGMAAQTSFGKRPMELVDLSFFIHARMLSVIASARDRSFFVRLEIGG